ncbi:acyl-CoA dehydrogenase family protein [Ferrimicrobium acidiphilum]|uniref:acyl-CoA dehydrogenase family protein n=1 Tax=Ferrimicrobium acidiphilum TaxID=121039 RepID=UPI0023F25A99|nr:acyl-CoA dehydrogenase family protein [Ferrimicrobium acidiphilum]
MRTTLNFALTAEQEELKSTTRRFLAQHLPTSSVRTSMESATPIPVDLWREMANGLGIAGLLIPEAAGGLELGFIEAACVLQEIGRSVAPLPFLVTSILGVSLLSHADAKDPIIAEIFAGINTGDIILGLVCGSIDDPLRPCGTWSGAGVTAESRFALDGAQATHLLVALDGDRGTVLALVRADAPGVTVTAEVTLDLTRPMAHVRFDSSPATVILDHTQLQQLTERFDAIASAGIAQDMIGGAERVLEMSVEYAKDRHQFGRPIGSFQAIKHRLADMLVDVESAKSTALYAAFTIADASDDQLIAAATAKSTCGDAYFRVAAASIQVHGGIGFTWEHDAHLYFKRAKADQILFGNGPAQRRKLAHLLGIVS